MVLGLGEGAGDGEEGGVRGGGELYIIAGGRTEMRGRSPPFPSCLRLSHPHERNGVDLPTGRAPLVRRLPLFRCFVCKPKACSFRTPKFLQQPSSSVSNGPCDRGPTRPTATCVCFRVGFPFLTARSYRGPPTIAKRLMIPCFRF